MIDARPDTPARQTAAPDIVAQALAGRDIRIFLEPDDAIEKRIGTERYIEALDLPHAIVADGEMWAAQRNLLVEPSEGGISKAFYAYYTGADIFASNRYPEMGDAARPVESLLMSTGRYKELRWEARGTFEPVYDSETPERFDDYVAAIREGARFKLRIEFEQGHTQIHPVIYPFFFPDAPRVEAQSELQFFPEFMRFGPDKLRHMLGGSARIFADYRDPELRERSLRLETPAFAGYFKVFDGGVGKRLYDLGSDAVTRFRRTVIFAGG